MRHGAGPGRTREDHLDVAAQPLAALAAARHVRELAELVGSDGAQRRWTGSTSRLATAFEREFMDQGQNEDRSPRPRAWAAPGGCWGPCRETS